MCLFSFVLVAVAVAVVDVGLHTALDIDSRCLELCSASTVRIMLRLLLLLWLICIVESSHGGKG